MNNKVLYLYTVLVLVLFITSTTLYSTENKINKDILSTADSNVRAVLKKFISFSRRKQFKEARDFTTGKEKEVYTSLYNYIKFRKGTVPAKIKNFFARLKKYKIDVVEIDKSLDKAVAICTFEFRYYDATSRDEVRKYREVLYYLEKKSLPKKKGRPNINKTWKISFSKLNNESYYYQSTNNKKVFKKY